MNRKEDRPSKIAYERHLNQMGIPETAKSPMGAVFLITSNTAHGCGLMTRRIRVRISILEKRNARNGGPDLRPEYFLSLVDPLKRLAGQTAIYGLSSIVGRLINFLLVPLYTNLLFNTSEYGVIAEMYAYVAFLLILLTYGMETAFFVSPMRARQQRKQVYSTTLLSVLSTSASVHPAGDPLPASAGRLAESSRNTPITSPGWASSSASTRSMPSPLQGCVPKTKPLPLPPSS
jgi:hypothetical protein